MNEIKEKLWMLAEEAMGWQSLYSQASNDSIDEETLEQIGSNCAYKIGDMIEEICVLIEEWKLKHD